MPDDHKMVPAPEAADVAIDLSAAILTVANDEPLVLVAALPGPEAVGLPSAPFRPALHRTLASGLSGAITDLTGLAVAHAEQIGAFGDRFRDPAEHEGGPRRVAIAHLALARPTVPLAGAEWRPVYDFLPWEDRRRGVPGLIAAAIRPALAAWLAAAPDPAIGALRRERLRAAFPAAEAAWRGADAALRWAILYEAELVEEARRDAWIAARHAAWALGAELAPPPPREPALGRPMQLDHRRILAAALARLRRQLRYRPMVPETLPRAFTLFQLQRTVEAFLGTALHKQNFRRLALEAGVLEDTGRTEQQTGGRPATLYRFRRDVLRERLSPAWPE